MKWEGKKIMFVIVTYDIAVKRVSKVMKTCRKYLRHVQKSVFEGFLTDAQLKRLKRELESIIKIREDKVCIYKLELLRFCCKEEIGINKEEDNIL